MNKVLLIFLIICSSNIFGQKSVLKEGDWLKIKVSSSGVYKLDLAFFKKYYANFKAIDPQKVKVYVGHIDVLPQSNKAFRTIDLKEIPVENNDSDRKLDAKDQILFYAADPNFVGFDTTKSRFSHKLNPYEIFNYYYINLSGNDALKIEINNIATSTNSPVQILEYFYYRENEQKNILSSGREWFGEFFYNSTEIELENIDAEGPILLNANFLGIGRANQLLDIKIGNESSKKIVLPKSDYNSSDNFARYNRFSNTTSFENTFIAKTEKTALKLSLSTENSANAGAFIDFFEIQYLRRFKFYPKAQLQFFHINKLPQTQFQIADFTENTTIWKIENPQIPQTLNPNSNGIFSCSTTGIFSTFLVFDKTNIPTPEFVNKTINQDIKSNETPELLIIYPKKFKGEVERLIKHKKTAQNIEALGLTTEEVYNEFSSGKTDPTAIRDLCRYFWKKDPSKFRHLMLFGDASYDFKNNNKATYLEISNFVPTYQSKESLEPIYSFSSDDYFGFLEDREGEWNEGLSQNNTWISNRENDHDLDIAIGRLPAKSLLEARNLVNKIVNYQKNEKYGLEWYNKLTFIADNRDYNIHQNDADRLSQLAQRSNGVFEIEKIYLDNYNIITNGQNINAPDATKALTDALNNGSYLINYNGHGSEDGWAQEKLLTVGEILNWRNDNKLPIFFTATCQFGKFDNPSLVSGAELALLNPNGGCIAMLTTTRPVYSSTNEKINSAFYKNLLKAKTLGELFKLTKNNSIEGEINRNFTLLGDPSQPLPNWNQEITITKSNDNDPKGQTWKALEKIQLIGESKTILNGKIKIKIFDKPITKKTKGTYSDGPIFQYFDNNQQLFEGVYSIQKGIFKCDIILPKDQMAGIGPGQLVIKAINEDSTINSFGYFNDFLISSEINQNVSDKSPPDVKVSLSSNQTLIFDIFDENGINLSNFDPSHKMRLIIDDTSNVSALSYFVLKENNKWGILNFYVGALPEGKHKVKLIVFDNYNNKTEKTFEFVIDKPIFRIESYLNYPNPFSNFTSLIFKHNRLGSNVLANLVVFDTYGNTIMQYQKECKKCDEKIDFGLDFEGKKNVGIQLYFKISLLSQTENESTQASGKLLFWK